MDKRKRTQGQTTIYKTLHTIINLIRSTRDDRTTTFINTNNKFTYCILCLKAMHFGVRSDDINLLGSVSIVFLYPIDFSV
jgi:hypothetical protein